MRNKYLCCCVLLANFYTIYIYFRLHTFQNICPMGPGTFACSDNSVCPALRRLSQALQVFKLISNKILILVNLINFTKMIHFYYSFMEWPKHTWILVGCYFLLSIIYILCLSIMYKVLSYISSTKIIFFQYV